jgi:hypothetical protein
MKYKLVYHSRTVSCGDGCCSWSEHYVELVDETGCVCDEYGAEYCALPYMVRVEELHEWVKKNFDQQMYTGSVTGMKRFDELDLELIIGEDRSEYNHEENDI